MSAHRLVLVILEKPVRMLRSCSIPICGARWIFSPLTAREKRRLSAAHSRLTVALAAPSAWRRA